MHFRVRGSVAAVLVTALLLAACGGGGGSDNAAVSRGDLVGASSRGSASAPSITDYGATMMTGYTATYGATCQQIVYKTPAVDGALIDASALLCVPQKGAGATSPILSYDHGTIFADSDAPSAAGSSMGFAAAGLGYITVMPDYIGYGASSSYPHPYLHAQTLASATVDAVRATRHYLQQQGIGTNGKLFLTGYSEGGYAVFATQRSMEQEFPDEFTITASVPGAGPYDLSQTAADMLALDTLPSAAYAAFIVSAYDAVYNPVSQLSSYFNEPYDERAATAFDGTHSGMDVELMFTTTTGDLLHGTFLDAFRSDGETLLKSNLAENNLHDTWVPQSKTVLFHGEGDEIVPYANTTAAAAHAAGHDVTVANCVGVAPTTHSNCGLPYWQYLITFFPTLDPGL